MLSPALLCRPRSCVALSGLILLVALALFITPTAQAQGYPGGGGGYPGGAHGSYVWSDNTGQSPTYSGGQCVISDAGGPGAPIPYGPRNASGWGGGQSKPPNGSAVTEACSGAITATFTWKPDPSNPNEPPPASVVVKQDCTLLTYLSPGATTSYSTGLGHSGNGSGYPDDVLYTVQSNPGQAFSITPACSPSLTVTTPATSNVSGGTVQYSATAYPVTVDLGGTTKDSSGADNILIGQGCTASMSAGPAALSNFQWTVPGQTFQNFVIAPDQSSAQANPIPSSTWSSPTPQWHWSQDETVTVSAQADASINGVFVGRVSAQAPVKIWAPDYLFKPMSGPVSVDNISANGSPISLYLYAGGSADASGHWNQPGMLNGGRVSTPNLFRLSSTGNTGTGSWEFGQIIFPGRWLYYYDDSGNSQVAPLNYNGQKLLDNAWPYPYSYPDGTPAGPWPADSVDQSPYPNTPTYWMQDSPATPLVDYYHRAQVDESFNDFMMYLPPDNGYGADWVPLHLYTWKWQSDVSRFGTWAQGWTPHPPGYTSDISSVRCTTHPQWSSKLTNSNMHF